MNQRAIWLIIGVMALAMLGIVGLQASLIRTAIRENQRAFDEKVYVALRKVVAGLEEEEKQNNSNAYVSGFMRGKIGEQSDTAYFSDDIEEILHDIRLIAPSVSNRLEHLLQTHPWAGVTENDAPGKTTLFGSSLQVSNSFLTLESRLNKEHLDATLRQELQNSGIDTRVSYAVYSRERDDIILVDGHYTYLSENETVGTFVQGPGNYQQFLNSAYSVHLFPQESPSPGKLMLYFPARQQLLWRDLWQYFLGLTILMTIILLCFSYTIYVIFRQKKVSEMKNDFINNMTHEFKTPIATISLAADSITSPRISGDPSKVSRFAGIIKQENKRMNNQVEKVLQMALLEKDNFQLNISEINLHSVIENAIENITLRVEKKQGTARAELNATQPVIQGEIMHVQNIINNLLDNADKYTPDNPDIVVYTRDVQKGVEVVIKDNGIGMTAEARKHIFDKFYRVHTGNRHDVKGFGLGLSYVKAMMTAHGGSIHVKSELGKGSSFVLFFPHKFNPNERS